METDLNHDVHKTCNLKDQRVGVEPSGEVADLNFPHPLGRIVADKCESHLLSHCLVCLFLATVETCQCNMADSVEEDPLPLEI